MLAKKHIQFLPVFFILLTFVFTSSSYGAPKRDSQTYQTYIDFFEEVYKTMNENYYQPVSRKAFKSFIKQFDKKIYSKLLTTGKSVNYIRWRSAALMVEKLRTPDDRFSAFMPPEPAKEFYDEVLSKRIDLGIEGEMTENGFTVSLIEPRVDAYAKGLRELDSIVRINGESVFDLTGERINEFLNPEEGSETQLDFVVAASGEEKQIAVTNFEYFKKMIFMVPTGLPGIYCLELRRFNRKTGEDMARYLSYFRSFGDIKGLIIDLRGNPGGPPLAAREISSFFLTPNEEFAYFQRRYTQSPLDVPEIPEEFRYTGPMVVLVDEGSGSASELFAGVLQQRHRAVLMGESTAGAVMLKSMFSFEDDSMVLLVTARGHHPNGMPFSFDGLNPDRVFKEDEKIDPITYAARYLIYFNQKQNTN